ncbi:MAG: carbohydrate kinase family protein [bacterium]
MYDLITFGNVTSDLYFDANNLTTKGKRFYLAIGGKYFVEDYYHFVGGGATNVAIGVRKNRIKSAICGVVGNNEFRKAILHKLKLKKVSLKMILFKQQHLNLSVIFLKKDGSRTIINYETPKQDLLINNQLLKKLKNTRSVYLGNLPDVPLKERIKLLFYLKKHNIITFLNLGSSDLKKNKKDLIKLITFTDVLIMNRYEFSELVKKNPKGLNLKSNLLKLIPDLKQKLLVITDAENGSYAYFENNIYYYRAIKPKKIIDTTGAGDAYTAGFISQYLKTEDIKKSMRRGAYYASKIIGRIGAN